MKYPCVLASIAILGFAVFPASAQRDRVSGPVRGAKRQTLSGHVPVHARAENDEGRVARDLRLQSMTLVLKPSGAQQADLEQLLADQQNPSSPSYHRWLTPEQYADRFGISATDLRKIADWLAAQHLSVSGTARARNWVAFSGTAQDVENAFGTEIHHYLVNGELHFSNATDPSLPEPLTAVVRAIHGLNDFRMKPKNVVRRPISEYTSTRGGHYLAPDDIAAIYDVQPLFDAGINGSGQKIVVVGQTRIDPADIRQFRASYNLPPSDPQITLVPNTRDPGVVRDDETEADLDIEWSGAVARNASIQYVYSYNVMNAVLYAIDQNLAPVMSMSYGLCESETGSPDALTERSWAQQANAQGMTWIAAAGDSGGADCAISGSSGGGLAVDLPAAVPEVTAVGGTEFNDWMGSYWNTSNNATKASAFAYIPEVVWNDSPSGGTPSAGGGGASTIFEKPSWQSGLGVPSDGARDVPDVSLAASAQHDGYMIYSGGQASVVGGTSVAAPIFAGIAALVNQRSAAQGNINPRLYTLAQSTPGAFHDVVSGSNKVTITCGFRSRNCTSGTFGYDAGPGYDLASGLGSVDAYRMVMAWDGAAPRNVPPSISGITNGASFRPAFAPGTLVSVFGSQLAPGTVAAQSVPLPTQLAGVSATVNGAQAPLYYVSPEQINLQIPEQLAGGPAVVTVSNNGQTASARITLAAVAPGIFTDAAGAVAPFARARRGEVITLYVTGTGSSLPTLAVTVGGAPAAVSYAGTPSGLQGVVLVKCQVPRQAAVGAQAVVVTAGGVASPAATLTVQ